MKPVAWAIVGCRGIAESRMLPAMAASELAQVHTLVTRDPSAAKPLAEQYRASAVTDDLAQAVTDPAVEAVYIATPVFLHQPQIRACLVAGKAVLCEKPLALDLAQAEEIRDEVKRSGLLFMEGYMMRFHQANVLANRLIHEGKLGTITFAQADVSFWYPPADLWRQRWDQGGGGALMDVGSHAVHLLQTFLGPVRSVQALTHTQVHDYQVDDGSVLLMEIGHNVHAVIRAAFNARPGRSHYRIAGTSGEIEGTGLMSQEPDGTLVGRFIEPGAPDEATRNETFAYEPKNTYRAMVEAFAQALRAGRNSTVNDIEDSVSVMRVIDAAYRSNREKTRIELSSRPAGS